MGHYPGTLYNKDLPDALAQSVQARNPIPECKALCAAKWSQGPQLLVQCSKCLDNCTNPWGDNIDTCVDGPLCNFEHYKGIQKFCVPMAYCYSRCVGTALKSCRFDGRVAAGTGIAALTLGLLPLFVIPAVCGVKHLVWIVFAFLSFLSWLAAIIIGADALSLNMGGKGWSWLVFVRTDSTYEGKVVTPNYQPGLVLCLLMIHLFFMLLAFWDPKEVWYRNQYNVRQEEYEKKLAEEKKMQEEQVRLIKEREEREARAEEERLAREEDEEEKARLDKYYYGKKDGSAAPVSNGNNQTSIQETKQREGPAPVAEADESKPPVNVTVGLSFAQNSDGEVAIDSVAAGGPAAKTGLIHKGDVVCEVGDTDPNGRPMKEVYKQDIDKWAHIVKGGAPGTSVRFILARHAEQKRFIADIVREAVN